MCCTLARLEETETRHGPLDSKLWSQDLKLGLAFFGEVLNHFQNKNCVHLRGTTWCLYIHSEMITTIKLINISLSSHSYYLYVCTESTWDLLSANFQHTIRCELQRPLLYVRSLDLARPAYVVQCCTFDQPLPISPHLSGPRQPLFCLLLLWIPFL